MSLRYLEINDISHLSFQSLGGGIYNDNLWRESYYFNMCDPRSGLSLITTIGLLPNRKLTTGMFVLISSNKKDGILIVKPIIERNKPTFKDYSFIAGNLEYSIDGVNWRLKYNSRKIEFDILFTPLNKIYQYVNDASDLIFSRVGSQHYEQFGVFDGVIRLKNQEIKIGPCFGHRDHSWGIRDWSAIDYYRLFCCAFSLNFAINLWEGSIAGQEFVKGYVFDGNRNVSIMRSKVNTIYKAGDREPTKATIQIVDEENRKYNVTSQVLHTIPLPPRQSVMYEMSAEMCTGNLVGYGLQEYLYHEPNFLSRFWIFLKLITMI